MEKAKTFFAVCAAAIAAHVVSAETPDTSKFEKYTAQFNAADEELVQNLYPNSQAAKFLSENAPVFECPDAELERVYYFRWWTFRKHVKQTPDGYVITEFLPKVPWSGLYNAISCPGAHHFAEGRWLADKKYLEAYARYWFNCGNNVRKYTFPVAHSVLELYKVSGDKAILSELFGKMRENAAEWEKSHYDAERGLFWQRDSRDGMEYSISGSLHPKFLGYRATINAHMYGEYRALSEIAGILGDGSAAKLYAEKAAALKDKINTALWDESARFFKVIPFGSAEFSDVRELHGYTPWVYNIPPKSRSDAWRFLSDASAFKAPYGPTTAEQSHPKFAVAYEGHECLWNGPSWPFATSTTLNALANFINANGQNAYADKGLYFDTLQTYAMSHHRVLPDGRRVMWIDENINPYTGDWISRTRLEKWENGTWSKRKGGRERGKDYNHSQFCNHVISELVGVRPNLDSTVEINPLVPDSWDYFYLGNVSVKGRKLEVVYDRFGTRYGKGAGLSVYVDGKLVGRSAKLSQMKLDMEKASATVSSDIKPNKAAKHSVFSSRRVR